MTKGSDSREFFEIFKQTEKAEDTQKKEVKPQDVSSQPPRPSVPESKPLTLVTLDILHFRHFGCGFAVLGFSCIFL